MTGPSSMVDWRLAAATGRTLAGAGPQLSPDEVRSVVSLLRELAGDAQGFVAAHTGLHAPVAAGPVSVVDRAGWVQANADAMAELLRPLTEEMARARAGSVGAATPFALAMDTVGPRLTGLEAGAMLGFLASKVLGQYDPYGEPGRLLLVAPNIVDVADQLQVDRRDFALWVCLHEETHRVQFTAVPWLRTHLRAEIDTFLLAVPLDTGQLAMRLLDVAKAAAQGVRDGQVPSLVDLVQTPQQREVLDRLAAVMSLLEGHAEVVMDGVGPDVVPSVALIRRRFDARRGSAVGLSRVLRRLLGLEAKMRQYQEGARFVRGAVDEVGMTGFNAVWAGPAALPTASEIADPLAWVSRVHG